MLLLMRGLMHRDIPFIFLTNGSEEKIKVKTLLGDVYIYAWDNDYKIGNKNPITITFGELDEVLYSNCRDVSEIVGEQLDQLVTESIRYRNEDKSFLFFNKKIKLVRTDQKSVPPKKVITF